MSADTSNTQHSLGADDVWEIYQDPKAEWRWRRTAKNGNIVGASTQGYKQRGPCIANAARAGFKPKGKVAARKTKGAGNDDGWEFYNDKAGGYRWRRVSVNGRIVGAATEAYSSAADAEENAIRLGYKPGKSVLLSTLPPDSK